MMSKKIKFYFKENLISLSIVATIFMLNILYLILYDFSIQNIEKNNYFHMNDIMYYSEMFVPILNIICICILISMLLFNTLNVFSKSRKFKFIFSSLNTVNYVFNPILVLLILFNTMFITLSSNIQYLYSGYKNLFTLINSNLNPLIIYVLFGIILFIVYFMLLILYKQLSYYLVKYYNLKRKFIFITLHIIMTSIACISLILFMAQFISTLSYNSSGLFWLDIQIGNTFYLNDHFVFKNGFGLGLIALSLFIVLFTVIYKNVSLDRNLNGIKYRKIIIVGLFILMSSGSILKMYKIVTLENKVVEEKLDGANAVGYFIEANEDIEYDQFMSKLEQKLNDANIKNYDIYIDNYLTDNLSITSFKSTSHISEKGEYIFEIGVVYDLRNQSDIILKYGSLPKDFTEVIIPESLARLYMETKNFDSLEEIIGKEYGGQTVVGIIEDNANTSFVPKYFNGLYGGAAVTEEKVYTLYSRKDFNEEVYDLIVNKSSNYNFKNSLENSGGVTSYGDKTLVIDVYVLVYDEDYIASYDENYVDEMGAEVEIYDTNLYTMRSNKDISIYILVLIPSVMLLVSLMYLTSNKERRDAKNV